MQNMSHICYTFSKHLILLTSNCYLFVFIFGHKKKKKKKNEFVKFKNVKKHLQLQFLEI